GGSEGERAGDAPVRAHTGRTLVEGGGRVCHAGVVVSPGRALVSRSANKIAELATCVPRNRASVQFGGAPRLVGAPAGRSEVTRRSPAHPVAEGPVDWAHEQLRGGPQAEAGAHGDSAGWCDRVPGAVPCRDRPDRRRCGRRGPGLARPGSL